MTAEQRDPGWRWGDDYERHGGDINSARRAAGIGESAQAEWEHGETRPLQTREEIHNAAIRRAMKVLAEENPGKLWTSGEIVDQLFDELYIVNGRKLGDRPEWLDRQATAEQPSVTTDFPFGVEPGSAESWALVAIAYLQVGTRRDDPISDVLRTRIISELSLDKKP